MPARENPIVRSIATGLQKRGAMVVKTHGDPFFPAGTPDLIGCYQGQAFAIEGKAEGEQPTKKQKLELAKWSRAGARVGVARSLRDALDILGIAR